MVDDGLLSFKVIELGADWVRCRLENSGRLGETKGINLPGIKVFFLQRCLTNLILTDFLLQGEFASANRKGSSRHSVWNS